MVEGTIVAGPHVRNAARRHLADLERGHDRGLRFDLDAAQYAFDWYEQILRLSEGQFEGKPFTLHPSQAFIIGSLFGWKKEDGTRRFRRAYIEIGKGNGKSPMAGGLGLLGLCADGEAGSQVYSAAAKKEQAGILFQDACKMVRASPVLEKKLEFSGGQGREFNIAFHAKSSFFRPVSRDTGKTGSGPRPYFVLVDEVHELPDRKVIEILERGFKFRRQPILFMITNSGSDRNSVAWEERTHAINCAAGSHEASNDSAFIGDVIDDSTFSYVCSLDDERTETFSYCEAMKHMRNSCTCHNVPTTLIDRLQAEVFAKHAIYDGIDRKGLNAAQRIQIDPSSSLGCVDIATKTSLSGKPQKSESKNGDTSRLGTRKTESDSELIKKSGSVSETQDTDGQWQSSKPYENTESPEFNSSNSSKNKTGSAASAASIRSTSASTIATTAGSIGDFSANPATLELVFSEILQRTWSAHSPTCETRKSELLGSKLKANFPADDPLNDPSCWIKANPLLGVTITEEYLQGVVDQAKAIPGKLNGILRLHFCVWTDAETAWMTRATLEPLIADFDPEIHAGREVYEGLDLSQSRDITAKAYIRVTGTTKDGKPTYDGWVQCFTPGDTLAQRELRDKMPYTVWHRQGHIEAPPGENVNYLHVAQSIAEDSQKYKVAMVAYDRYAFRRFEEETEKLGLNVEFVEHPQGGVKKGKPSESQIKAAKHGETIEGLWMPGSLKLLEDAMLEGRIRLKRNPVLISAMMSAVTEGDRWGNFWLAKTRSINKIDAVVALCMAIGAANSAPIKAKKLVLGVVR